MIKRWMIHHEIKYSKIILNKYLTMFEYFIEVASFQSVFIKFATA